MKKLLPLVAASLAVCATPSFAQAQAEATATALPYEQSPHRMLVEAFSPMSLHEITFITALAQIDEFYRDNPDFAAIDLKCPGFIDAIFDEARPSMREFHFAEAGLVRDLLLEIFTEKFTVDQAREGVELYGSPLGQKMVHLSGKNQNFKNTMVAASEDEEGDVDRRAFDRDSEATTARLMHSMSREEIMAFGEMAIATEFFPLLQKLLPEIQQRRFELLNSDVLAKENAAFSAALDRGMQTHLEQCGL